MLTRSRHWIALLSLSTVITACGGGGGGGSSAQANSSPSMSPAAGGSNSEAPAPTPTPIPAANINQTVHVSWNAPTTRTDGSALPTSAIKSFNILYTRDGSTPDQDKKIPVSGTSTATDVTLTVGGTYTFAITAVDTNDVESALSEPSTITVN